GEEPGRRGGHLDRSMVANDVACLSRWIGQKPPGLQTGILDELRNFGRGLEDGIGPKLGEKSIPSQRLNNAPSAPAAFINGHRHASAFEVKRGRQTRNASADDCDGFHWSVTPAKHQTAAKRMVLRRLIAFRMAKLAAPRTKSAVYDGIVWAPLMDR